MQDRIASRLSLAPRLRQVVHRPERALGTPIWVDAPWFNITDHVRTRPLPAGAGQSELLQTCEELRQRPLDRSRPLWQLWLLPGLPGNEVGMFVRIHHAIADGLAGVELLSNLLDHTPDTTRQRPRLGPLGLNLPPVTFCLTTCADPQPPSPKPRGVSCIRWRRSTIYVSCGLRSGSTWRSGTRAAPA